ncbi:unnamed protein product, partial [marine sediment metagenome]
KLEKVRTIREICKTGYFILTNTKVLKHFGHGLIMVIQKEASDQ